MGTCWTSPEDKNHALALEMEESIAEREVKIKAWRATIAELTLAIVNDPVNQKSYENQINQTRNWIKVEEDKIAEHREVHRLIKDRDTDAKSAALFQRAARLGERYAELSNPDDIADAIQALKDHGEAMDEVFVEDDDTVSVPMNIAFTRREERRVLLSS